MVTGEAGSGLPIIASDACGAAHDVIRQYYSGIMFPQRDAEALARAMRWMHEHEAELPEMGRRAHTLAAPFGAAAWARRWHQYMLETFDRGGPA